VTASPHWGEPPWRVEPAPEPGPLPARCEVAVVGGGFTGLATAYQLARQGKDVVLLEARRLGSGASGRTGGIVLEDTSAGPLPQTDDCIGSLQHTLQAASIECDLDLPGCWELAHATSGTRLWRDAERNLVRQDTVPGGTLDPGKLLSGLAAAAREEGAAFHEHALVQGISGGGPLRLEVGGTELRADHVVLGLNAYTGALISPGDDFHPALTLALCSEPLPAGTLEALGLGGGHAFYTLDMPYLWGRPLERERVIFGGGLAFDASRRVERIDLRTPEVARSLAQLEQRVRGLHPGLAEVRIARRWGGPVAFRSSRTPILARHPTLAGLILSGAYAGHGVALSVRVAELAARAILEGGSLPAWGELEPSSETREVG